MAWIVGLATDEEIDVLRARGHTVTEPTDAVRRQLAVVDPENETKRLQPFEVKLADGRVHRTRLRAVQVYVDADLYQLLRAGSETLLGALLDTWQDRQELARRYLDGDLQGKVPDYLPPET